MPKSAASCSSRPNSSSFCARNDIGPVQHELPAAFANARRRTSVQLDPYPPTIIASPTNDEHHAQDSGGEARRLCSRQAPGVACINETVDESFLHARNEERCSGEHKQHADDCSYNSRHPLSPSLSSHRTDVCPSAVRYRQQVAPASDAGRVTTRPVDRSVAKHERLCGVTVGPKSCVARRWRAGILCA